MFAILLWLLTACNTGGLEPTAQIVHDGLVKYNELIALQLNLSPPPSFEIERLAIAWASSLKIQNATAYRVSGTYNLITRRPKQQVIQKQNHFEIYLQRQQEGKTWRLLIPQLNDREHPVWLTYSFDYL